MLRVGGAGGISEVCPSPGGSLTFEEYDNGISRLTTSVNDELLRRLLCH